MSDYWIMDGKGRVLGPIHLAVVKDLLASGRINTNTSASQDGVVWIALGNFPELRELFHKPDAVKQTAERERAQAILLELDQLSEQSDALVFGVPEDSSLEVYRRAFFEKVKRYHPAGLPERADPALKSASQKMFEFLRSRLSGLMRKCAGAEKKVASAPKESARASRASFAPDEFVGFERRRVDRVPVELPAIVRDGGGMFSRASLVDLSSGGAFIVSRSPVSTGTTVKLEFKLDGSRPVCAEGMVIWVNNGAEAKHPIGFGVRFEGLPAADRQYIEEFVARTCSSKRRP